MAPAGKTSLLAEMPCDPADAAWTAPDAVTADRVVEALVRIGWIARREVLASHVARMSHAYPVAELGLDEQLCRIWAYLRTLDNLTIVGRNAQFRYTWIHVLLAAGKQAIDDLQPA
jgi:protoporphyrinogen oxidase